jgi:hypothetical protein
MKRLLLLPLLLAGVGYATPEPEPGADLGNTAVQCINQGAEPGTPAYEACIDGAVDRTVEQIE